MGALEKSGDYLVGGRKEMRGFIEEWKARKRDLAMYAGILAGVWAAGVMLVYLLRVSGGQGYPVAGGSMMAAMSFVGAVLCGFGADFSMTYDLAVGFGKTRRKFLGNTFAVYLVNGILLALEVRLLLEAEIFHNRICYRGVKILRPDSVYLSAPWVVALTILLIGLALFGGMLLHKFRGKAVAALMLLWLFVCLEMSGETTISRAAIEGFLHLSVEIQFVLTSFLGITVLTASAAAMRKEPVRG